ncbi:hypothetical protein ARALYDRAFT_913462 [Arabidopsis lyrata subsp. lyrata]|uniref:Uncharacterized protein n=1 Tax=Arabidopsis lyrata subsp. lyrata TaxID=81972 RepID=D7MC75_ARALL|nr:hypothetical protein ARALYDRAFT_913462 [Arabidopsis lyrata subsp. lyrata]
MGSTTSHLGSSFANATVFCFIKIPNSRVSWCVLSLARTGFIRLICSGVIGSIFSVTKFLIYPRVLSSLSALSFHVPKC